MVVTLKGGMGNQMFQYAFGYAMSRSKGIELKLDLTHLLDRSKPEIVPRIYDLDLFGVPATFTFNPIVLSKLAVFKSSFLTKLFRKYSLSSYREIKEKGFHYHSDIAKNIKPDSLYNGWWQSPKYFERYEKDIQKVFTLKAEVIPHSKEVLHNIISNNSVCLNVRRTDFLNVDALNVTNLDYFKRGVELIENEIENPLFFIFSDDIGWCTENFGFIKNKIVVDHSHKGSKFGNYFLLMQTCKHFIIPNSSFAWWAAWLSRFDEKIVICPKKWFNDQTIDTSDLIPNSWVRI